MEICAVSLVAAIIQAVIRRKTPYETVQILSCPIGQERINNYKNRKILKNHCKIARLIRLWSKKYVFFYKKLRHVLRNTCFFVKMI